MKKKLVKIVSLLLVATTVGMNVNLNVLASEHSSDAMEDVDFSYETKLESTPVLEEAVGGTVTTSRASDQKNDELTWSIDTKGVLTVSGKGYPGGGFPWAWYKQYITEANIELSDFSSAYRMFEDCSSLVSIDLSKMDTSSVKDMARMFYGCSSLTSLDVGNFDTSKVTDMSDMFNSCASLKNLNLTSFDTKEVKDFGYMFNACKSLENLDMSSFETPKATDMRYMFKGCEKITSLDISKLDTSNFNTSGSGSLEGMFYDCKALTNINFGSFSTTNVNNMSKMFYDCTALEYIDVSSFNTSEVYSMSNMFFGCSSLKELNLKNFNTSKVGYMFGMFAGCKTLKEIDLKCFDTTNVENMSRMFSSCSNIETIDISSFNTVNVYDMSDMFRGCESLKNIDLTSLNTSKVTNMSNMFYECKSLTELDVSTLDTSLVERMEYMFYGCKSLKSLDISTFETKNVKNFGNIFKGCKSLEKVNFSSLNTGKLEYMNGMFEDCEALKSVDLSGFDTTNVINMEGLFRRCKSIKHIDLSSWNTDNLTNMNDLFSGCTSLQSVDLSSFYAENYECEFTSTYIFYDCNKLNSIKTPRYLTENVEIPIDPEFSWHYEDGTKYNSEYLPFNDSESYHIIRDLFSDDKQSFNVFFDANGGVCQIKSIEVTEGENYGELPKATMERKCFKGWFTEKTAGKKITSSNIVSITEDITLYAQWNDAHGECEVRNAVEPTCIDEGYTGDSYCRICDTKIVIGDTISANGIHIWIDNDKKPASCTEEGYEGGQHCKNCTATQGDIKTLPKLGHDFDKEGTVTKEPTLRAEGERTHKCSRCDASEKKPIAKLVEEGKEVVGTPETKTNEDGSVTTVEKHTDETVREKTSLELTVTGDAKTKAQLVVDKDSSNKITNTEVKVETSGKPEFTPELVKAVKDMVADKTATTAKKANPDITLVTKDAAGNEYNITAKAKDLKKNAKLSVFAIDPVTGKIILTSEAKLKCDKKGGLEAPSLNGDKDYKLLSTKDANKALKDIKKTIVLNEKTGEAVASGSYIIKLKDGYNPVNVKDIDYSISSKKGSVDKATGTVTLDPKVTKGSVSVKVTVELVDGSKVKLTQKIKIKK